MSITRKHFIALSSFLIVTVLLLMSVVYYAIPIYQNQQKMNQIKINYYNVVHAIDGKSIDEMISHLNEQEKLNSTIYYSLTDVDGNLIYPTHLDELTQEDLEQSIENHYYSDVVMTNNKEPIVLIGQYIFFELNPISQRLVTYYPFIILFFIGFSLLFAYFYSFLATRRVKYLSKQTEKMQSLEPSIRTHLSGVDEISQLSKNIDQLYCALMENLETVKKESQLAQEREKEKDEFLRIAAHELKTPVTSMLGIVQGMKYGVGDFKNHDHYFEVLEKILNEQSTLVASLLQLSSLDIRLIEQVKEIDINEILSLLVTMYDYTLNTKNIHLHTHLNECQTTTHPVYIEKVLKNLIENAIRYAPAHSEIKIQLINNTLIIENKMTTTLTEEQIKKLTEPFYRPDYSRNRKDGGTGLGLFIVAQILEKLNHPFSFTVKDHYFIVTIEF